MNDSWVLTVTVWMVFWTAVFGSLAGGLIMLTIIQKDAVFMAPAMLMIGFFGLTLGSTINHLANHKQINGEERCDGRGPGGD